MTGRETHRKANAETVHDTMNDPQMTRPDPAFNPNLAQRRAADPEASVWVGASAGAGKTKVLTDRVLRLLLPREDGSPGTAPEKILCLTFTKAAASEMALRIGQALGRWAILPESELSTTLEKLLGRHPSSEEKTAARQLFARIVDLPGGLRIMTLHSFCKSILSRFPLEAGLHPGFEVAEEGASRRMLETAIGKILARAGATEDGPLTAALDALAAELTEDRFRALLADLCQERHQLEQLAARYWGAEGIYTEICRTLDVPPGLDAAALIRAACADGAFDEPALRRAGQALIHGGGQKDTQRAQAIFAWCDAPEPERFTLFETYRRAFFTAKDEVLKSYAVKAAQAHDPDCDPVLRQEAERLAMVQERVKSAECAILTRSLLQLGLATIEEYQSLKNRSSALDYDDLIMRTLDLLQGRSMNMSSGEVAPWIMYKLDQGIDHILIDEAQDTNPEQWEIVTALCTEFFSGAGAREDAGTRTVFSVGDRKQSIFSFQRAAPDRFARMQTHFSALARAAGQRWEDVDMAVSFRSGESVLRLVDAVFADAMTRSGVSDPPTAHLSYRKGQAALAEIWPVFETPSRAEADDDPWAMPTETRDQGSGAAQLANHIAQKIRFWLDSGEILPARDRPVRAGDIMILMRTRTAFVGQLVRALKLRGVPVSGVDRMVLTDQLAVQDLLALAAFSLLPEDDLSLACALKSPLIGFDEDTLFAFSHGRGAASLWASLRERAGDREKPVVDYLKTLIARAGSLGPYEFFAAILQEPCPADAQGGSGFRAIRARLGDEVLDPIDEFLNAALEYERGAPGSLQGFVQTLSRPGSGIKRQMEDSADCVRIMTVHGAKGLQAPIVILPDTLRVPAARRTARLLWPDRTDLPVPLWVPRSDLAPARYRTAFAATQSRDDEEYRRLLYVALTRAEDRLYICGYRGRTAPLAESWYNYVDAAFARLEDIEFIPCDVEKSHENKDSEKDVRRISNSQIATPDRTKTEKGKTPTETGNVPWLHNPPPPEPSPPRPLTPSRPAETEPAALSPLAEKDGHRFRRGILTHRLLELLPELPPSDRENAARRFLERQGQDLPETIREGVLRETLNILEHSDFAPLFGPGALAEVPVTGLLADGRLVSGQIDRLLVTDTEIWIVDYKTNRPPPENPKDVPSAYRAQLRAYRDTLARIWPGHTIRTFLLWTDGPRMMEIRDL